LLNDRLKKSIEVPGKIFENGKRIIRFGYIPILYRIRVCQDLTGRLNKYNVSIVALKEIRWTIENKYK